MKKLIVNSLERTCDVVDRLPSWIPLVRRLGCPNGLALWSSKLDERWNTGSWRSSATQ